MEKNKTLGVLVDELKVLTVRDDIRKKLQDIETELLCNYYIAIDDVIIEPLLVEAYYKCEEFNDSFTHNSPRQKNRLCKIYIHETGRGGIDICLSKGNYPLAFLIKNALVYLPTNNGEHNNSFLIQTEIDDLIRDKNICGVIKKTDKDNIVYYVPEKEITVKRKKYNDDLKHSKIVFLKRKFDKDIKEKNANNTYLKEELAAFSIEDINKYKLTIEGGKERAVAQYIFKNNIEPTDENIKEYLGSRSKNVKEYVKQLKQGKEI